MALFNIFRLTTRTADLEDQVRQLQAAQKALESEWSSVYDSVRRTLAKIARRDQRERETAQEPSGATIGDQPDPNSLDLNERIRMSRRAPR
jgi:hypothetical protein